MTMVNSSFQFQHIIGDLDMETVISKSKFKPNALKYFRHVEKTGRQLIITDHGKPTIKIVPFSEDPLETLKTLL